ncbi:DegT/DnrJ/EryC1/StrS family aminotransferase [Bacteroidota bacterium]
MQKKIWLTPPHMGGSEQKYVQEAFDSNWIAPLGPNVDAFEKSLAQLSGRKHCAALSSGTAAIHLALIMLGVKPGDFVICQSFTFSATANPIAYLGAMPIFIDSEEETWNMNPELLEKAIQDKKREEKEKKIKAIIAVDLYGMPAKWKEILAIGEKYGIPVIDDAAEALGSKYDNRPAGSFGIMGILSFNGNKILTTSGGGALLSDDEALIEKARYLSTQARDPAPHYQHSEIGYNYRMSNILAGIGRGQLEVIEERVKQRKENHQFYKELFANVPGISFQREPGNVFYSNRWLTTILIEPDIAGFTNTDLAAALEKANIESRPLWKPMHLQPVFKDAPNYLNGVSGNLFNKGLCLPSGTNMTDDDRDRIAEIISAFTKKH